MKRKITAIVILCIALLVLTACQKEVGRTKYSADVVFDEEKMSVSCRLSVEFVNTYDFAIEKACFNVYGNAYRENAKLSPVPSEKVYFAYDGKINYGYVDFKKCLVDGKESKFALSGKDLNLLEIELKSPLEKGESVVIELEFEEKLAKVKHRLGYNDNCVNLGNFLPVLCVYENGEPVECPYYSIGDPFYSCASDYSVLLKTLSEFSVASSGECVNILNGGKYTTYTFEIENARDFAMSLSKNFNVISEKVDGVLLQYFYVDDENPSKSFEIAADALRTFNKLFCKYPYKTLTIAETPFFSGGMEYPSFCLIASGLSDKEKAEVIPHEIAHEWWYALVGTNGVENAFIDEGLAQYSTALFFENNEKYGVTRESCFSAAKKSFEAFSDIYKITGKTLDKKIAKSLCDFGTEYEYTAMIYYYTPVILDEIRELVGEDDFLFVLKFIAKEYAFRNISKDEFVEAFEKVCKVNASEVLEKILDGEIK